MRYRKSILLILLLLVVGAYVLTEKDYGPVNVAYKTLLGKYPDLELDLNAPPPDIDKKNITKHFSALGLRCSSERSSLGNYVCWAYIGKYNGIPAKLVAFFFDGNNLRKIRISFNGWNHKKILEDLHRKYGKPELTSHRGIHGEPMIIWPMGTGIIAASERLKLYEESVILWTSNGSIFQELIRKVEQLVKNENETKQIIQHQQAKMDGGPNITEYNTDSYFYRSLAETRKIPASLNNELINWIKANANRLPSPFMMELANRVYATDKQEAIKWYATFRLFSAYDAARCKDKTAAQGILRVHMLYPQIQDHVKNDAQSYASALPIALQWTKEQNFRGSPVWLCAHAISAFRFDENIKPVPVPVEDVVYPEEDWSGIWNQVITRHEELQ